MASDIPGNITSTQTLAIGSTAYSAIDYAGDTDWWKVGLTYGYAYQVFLEGATYGIGTLADPILRVYNAAGTLQYTYDDVSFVNWDSYATLTPLSNGTYYLSAGESGNDGLGTYGITIWRDELSSTLSAATVAVNSVSEIGHLGWQGDTSDWYRVTLTAGVQYQFDLIGSSNDGTASGLTLIDPWLYLRNSSGVALTSDDSDGLGGNSRIFFTPATSGTYFLDAEAYDYSTYGTYRLIVNSAPTSGSIVMGATQTGSVDFLGDVDRYSVELTAGVTYAFSLTGNTLLDPYVEVQDSSGANVASDDNSGGGLNSYVTYTPSVTGTYYLAARESGNDATGTYSARVWQLPTISIGNASTTEGNTGATNLVFTLTLSAASATSVSVTAATSGTATATFSSDYIPTSGVVTFAPGQTSATFSVQVIGDLLFEPTEALHVLLSNPTGAMLGDSNAYGSIFDNDNPYALPTDSYVTYQWYLYPSTGINVFPVWNSYTGVGVRVAVFDQGIDPNHSDLNDNLLPSLGRNASNLSLGGAPMLSSDNHGTMVAGTIAAERNGNGIVGVAYGASLISVYSPLTVSGMAGHILNAYAYAANFDVLNDSWGFAPQGSSYYALYGNWAFADNFLNPAWSATGVALATLASSGRHGLGTVVVQSAGNSFSVGDDTNLHNFQNSQFIITVAATDYAGKVTSYSSPGASVLIAAPGGGGGSADDLSNIVTTDRLGAFGTDPSDYTTTAGTSFSAPIVSGVVALMLQANPNLGYRDVQEILAYSARVIDIAGNDWEYNGASNWNGGGLHYDSLDHNLGFGLVDALAAVRLAETWSSVAHTGANREQVTASHSVGKIIPDGGGIGATSSAFDSIAVAASIEVERVEVTLNVTHPYIGDLSVLLISPSGTISFLLWRPQQNPLSAYGTSQDNIHFTFDTVLAWGESSVGSWGLAVYDNAYGYAGTLDSWTLNLIGKQATADDTYIYTNEFAEATVDQNARSILSDTGGVDTLNAAACTSSLLINLAPGSVSTIDGRSLTIAAGTVVENAYGGDGNDVIFGNDAANSLDGMRGNDSLDGGSGVDTAVYSGLRANYTIVATADGYTISSVAEGTDVLRNIEYAKFSDQTVTLTSKDIAPPHVAGISPADETYGVPINNNITFTFDESIQRGVGTITLRTSAGATIATYDAASSTNLSISGNTLTVNPTNDLGIFTSYKVDIGSGAIKDLAGNSFAGSSDYNFTTQTVDGLYHFFVVAFAAAPGVEYMNQLAEAWNFGLTLQQIVNIFTTKHQFTDTYPETMTNAQLTTQLVNNIVKSSASDTAKAEARADINWCLDNGWTRGDVIYTVFGNLATKPLSDPTWGQTALQFQNETAVAKYFTEVMHNNSTDLNVLRAIVGDVTQSTDVSTPEVIAALIGVELSHLG